MNQDTLQGRGHKDEKVVCHLEVNESSDFLHLMPPPPPPSKTLLKMELHSPFSILSALLALGQFYRLNTSHPPASIPLNCFTALPHFVQPFGMFIT